MPKRREKYFDYSVVFTYFVIHTKCVADATNQGTTKANCKNNPCCDVTLFRLKDKHPELLNDIRTLQRDLEELEQKYGKAKNDNDVFQAARQRAKSSFFAIMRPRLKCQNPAKYVDRGALDRDLMVLQRVLQNKAPVDQADDWRLPSIIEEYKTRKCSSLPKHENCSGDTNGFAATCTQF